MNKILLWFPTLVVSETSFVLSGERYTDSITNAVVCGIKKSRVHYDKPFSGSGGKPACSADDGKTGNERNDKGEVVNTIACSGCPKKDGECKLYYILLCAGETEKKKNDLFEMQIAKASGGRLIRQLYFAAAEGMKMPFKFEKITVKKKLIIFSEMESLPADESPLRVLGSPARGYWEIETNLAIGFDSDVPIAIGDDLPF